MISESIRQELVERVLGQEQLVQAAYCKLYYLNQDLPVFSGIAGILVVSRLDSMKLIRIADIVKFAVRFELEVYSNILRYVQVVGKCLVALPIPHRRGHTLVALQLQNQNATDVFLEAIVPAQLTKAVIGQQPPPEEDQPELEQQVEKALAGEFLKFT
jgi:hypothetical protein